MAIGIKFNQCNMQCNAPILMHRSTHHKRPPIPGPSLGITYMWKDILVGAFTLYIQCYHSIHAFHFTQITQKTSFLPPIQTMPCNMSHKRISIEVVLHWKKHNITHRGLPIPCGRVYVLPKIFMVFGEYPKCVDMSDWVSKWKVHTKNLQGSGEDPTMIIDLSP